MQSAVEQRRLRRYEIWLLIIAGFLLIGFFQMLFPIPSGASDPARAAVGDRSNVTIHLVEYGPDGFTSCRGICIGPFKDTSGAVVIWSEREPNGGGSRFGFDVVTGWEDQWCPFSGGSGLPGEPPSAFDIVSLRSGGNCNASLASGWLLIYGAGLSPDIAMIELALIDGQVLTQIPRRGAYAFFVRTQDISEVRFVDDEGNVIERFEPWLVPSMQTISS